MFIHFRIFAKQRPQNDFILLNKKREKKKGRKIVVTKVDRFAHRWCESYE